MLKIPSKSIAWLDYLFIFRPTLFFAVWIITLAGYSGYFIRYFYYRDDLCHTRNGEVLCQRHSKSGLFTDFGDDYFLRYFFDPRQLCGGYHLWIHRS